MPSVHGRNSTRSHGPTTITFNTQYSTRHSLGRVALSRPSTPWCAKEIVMPLMPGAEPLAIDSTHPDYGRVGELLLHGFTGSPKSMKP